MSAAELSRPIVILSCCITFNGIMFLPQGFFLTACYKWLLLKMCVISSLSADFVNTAYFLYADRITIGD